MGLFQRPLPHALALDVCFGIEQFPIEHGGSDLFG